MEEIKKDIKELIDKNFDINLSLTGDKLLDQANKAKSLDAILNKTLDECVDLLNNKYSERAKEFSNTGFVNQYLNEKRKQFLLG